jgi:hypothetical protein
LKKIFGEGGRVKKISLAVFLIVLMLIVSSKTAISADDEWVIEDVIADPVECGSGKTTLILKEIQCNAELTVDCLGQADNQKLMIALGVGIKSGNLIGKSFSEEDAHKSSVLAGIIQTIVEARGMASGKPRGDCKALESKE